MIICFPYLDLLLVEQPIAIGKIAQPDVRAIPSAPLGLYGVTNEQPVALRGNLYGKRVPVAYFIMLDGIFNQ